MIVLARSFVDNAMRKHPLGVARRTEGEEFQHWLTLMLVPDHRLGDCCSVYDAAGVGGVSQVVLGIPWRDFCWLKLAVSLLGNVMASLARASSDASGRHR